MTHMCFALARGCEGGYWEEGEPAPPGKPMREVEAEPGDWSMPPAPTVVSRLASGLMSSGLVGPPNDWASRRLGSIIDIIVRGSSNR